MSNSSFSVMDEAAKNSDFTIFCDIKDCGSGAKNSDFTENKLRELFDRTESWLIHIMDFYHYDLKQKYYLVVKNNDSRYYYTYLYDSVNIKNFFYHTYENDAIINHDRYSAFYEELQEYYNTHRTDLLRFKCPFSRHSNGIYIIVYIKKSNFRLDFCDFWNYTGIDIDFALKYPFITGVYASIDPSLPQSMPKYSKLNTMIRVISREEIIDFIKETNFTDEEKEKCYLKFIYSMAAGDRFKENYMELSNFSDKIFIKELCAKYNLVFSENCFVKTMKKLAKMIEEGK